MELLLSDIAKLHLAKNGESLNLLVELCHSASRGARRLELACIYLTSEFLMVHSSSPSHTWLESIRLSEHLGLILEVISCHSTKVLPIVQPSIKASTTIRLAFIHLLQHFQLILFGTPLLSMVDSFLGVEPCHHRHASEMCRRVLAVCFPMLGTLRHSHSCGSLWTVLTFVHVEFCLHLLNQISILILPFFLRIVE